MESKLEGFEGSQLWEARQLVHLAKSISMANALVKGGGFDVSWRDTPVDGFLTECGTALTNAIWRGDVAMVECLLAHGADVNLAGVCQKRTCFHHPWLDGSQSLFAWKDSPCRAMSTTPLGTFLVMMPNQTIKFGKSKCWTFILWS